MNEIEGSVQGARRRRDSWLDLLLYLVVGYGSFVLLSTLFGLLLPEITMATVVLLYLTNIFVFIGTVYLLGVRRGKISWREIGFLPPRWDWRWLTIALALTVVILPLRTCLGLLVLELLGQDLESLALREALFTAGGSSLLNFLVTLTLAGLLIPVAEELFFRGLLFTWFRRRLPLWGATLASSILFSLGHADSPAVVATSFVIGVVNALIYELTGSIWTAIAVHAINNTLAAILVFVGSFLSPSG
jgi:hypothetical protein